MKQLAPMDAMFVYQETATAPLHIGSMMVYDPPGKGQEAVRFKEILNRFNERLDATPVFRRKLAKVPFGLGAPYWIDDSDFDLEFHVRHIALPKPGDWRQFCILQARLHSRPVDMSRPPWEVYVIEGLDNINGLPKGSFALYFKIHHSAIDGATGNQIMEALHDSVPNPEPRKPAADCWQGEAKPSDLKMLGDAYIDLLKSPVKAMDLVKHAAKSRSKSTREAYDDNLNHKFKNRIRFNDRIPSSSRVVGGLRTELSEIKKIKNAVGGCTVNDVVLGVVGGAMRHYLSETDELPDQTLTAGIPINVRSSEEHNTEGGNLVSGMLLHLRTDIEDPVERIKLINEDAIATKAYVNAIGAERIQTIVDTVPDSIASLGMQAMARTGLASRIPLSHTVVTNVPGTQKPIYLCGAEASLWIASACLTDGIGLVHTIMSYNGYLFFGFLSAREMMPDPDFYHQCLNRSFQEILAAAENLAG